MDPPLSAMKDRISAFFSNANERDDTSSDGARTVEEWLALVSPSHSLEDRLAQIPAFCSALRTAQYVLLPKHTIPPHYECVNAACSLVAVSLPFLAHFLILFLALHLIHIFHLNLNSR